MSMSKMLSPLPCLFECLWERCVYIILFIAINIAFPRTDRPAGQVAQRFAHSSNFLNSIKL
jgi:hypothetical protein